MKLVRRSVVVALTWMLGCSAPALDGVDGAAPSPDKDGALAGDADEGNAPGAVDAPETTVPTPSTTSPLVAFKGGASIALRWSVVGQGLDGAARWNVLRDGTKIATVEPGYHPEFPEKDGKGFIDKDIRPAATYEYRIQVVDAAGGTRDLGSPLKVTTPSTFSPPPTIQLDTSKRPELASYFAQAKAFLEIWYPKVAYALAEPDYKPFSSSRSGTTRTSRPSCSPTAWERRSI